MGASSPLVVEPDRDEGAISGTGPRAIADKMGKVVASPAPMDSSQIDALVHRLLANPHDEQALATAHQAGVADPKSYALFLERVGSQSEDPAYASHWLSEAANVWSTTLGDAHRAARALMQAIDRDPTQRTAAERLAELYRDKGDSKALVALLEVRAKALAPFAVDNDDMRAELGALHEELGRLWGESMQQPKKALEHFRRAIECDSRNMYAIYGAREIHKSLGQWREAYDLYGAELALERDPARKVALLRDEAAARRVAGDLVGASGAIARARESDAEDAGLQQEYASTIIDRMAGGEAVPAQERTLAAELLVGLAEVYDGEHGLAYSSGALDIEPGHDRAMQLYAFYARALQREDEVSSRYLAYLEANPNGALAPAARWLLSGSYEAAGQLDEAVQVLEPLRALGDSHATKKLRELYGRTGQTMPSGAPGALPTATATGASPASSRPSASTTPMGALEVAQSLATAGKRDEAYAKFRELLERDPGNAEALSWVEDHLRTTRDYRALRDVLLAAARATAGPADVRQQKLREVAALSEGNLRDPAGAIDAWKHLLVLDRGDEVARQSLTRALERLQRWDDLAELLEQEATQESDLEKKIALERRLAALHETKRQDFAGAGQAWEHIANLTPDDDHAIATASLLYEKAGALDRAAHVIAVSASGIDDIAARAALLERLGQLRERLHEVVGAGEAYAEAATHRQSAKLWDAAERCFVAASQWERAGQATIRRSELEASPEAKARHIARAANHFARAGDDHGVIENLERALDLDPASDDFAQRLAERYTAGTRWPELVALFSRRGDRLTDATKRVASRREAARLMWSRLGDAAAASDEWRKVLLDGEDKEALEHLVDDAVRREDYEAASGMLRRLEQIAVERPDKARIALREAELVADGLGDVDTAVAHYERVLTEFDPISRPALQAIADLQEARDRPAAAADALERELKLVTEVTERGPIASRLARLYEQLDDLPQAIRALEILRVSDPEDFDALARLCDLCEKTHEWTKLADLLAQRIDVEADEGEISTLTNKLSRLLADRLERGDEALAVLTDLADGGDDNLRKTYIELGDRLGWRGVVAGKLVEWWFGAKPTAERTLHLRGAFERFADVGRDQEAVRVGCEIVRSRGADLNLAHRLEELAVKTRDLDAIATAHDLLVRELTGPARAEELVRQAEVRFKAGAPRIEALTHGEQGLTSIHPASAEALLQRLATIADETGEVIDLYQRQIGRCKTPSDRITALARAAQVAAAYGEIDRARALFDLALSGIPSDDAVNTLVEAAREADAHLEGTRMRGALSAALANGGQGARDGGRTRGSLLRRAASMAHTELGDIDQAFAWLGDALVAHVEPPTLDMLDALAKEIRDPRRAEATLTRALGEVFEGPLVRQLLVRRARLRRGELGDKTGAAADLKKLYDLGPSEPLVVDELAALLTELDDYGSMVQLYEDQILRGKDVQARAELARRVAGMWENELSDPREAADAWRRVLRMKPGDTEAAAGLERAKANMIRRPALSDSDVAPDAAPAGPSPATAVSSDRDPGAADVQPVEAPPSRPADVIEREPDGASASAVEAAPSPPADALAIEASTVEVPPSRPADALALEGAPSGPAMPPSVNGPPTRPSQAASDEAPNIRSTTPIAVVPLAVDADSGQKAAAAIPITIDDVEDLKGDPGADTVVRKMGPWGESSAPANDQAIRVEAGRVESPTASTRAADDTYQVTDITEDVIIADDLAEIIDADDDVTEAEPEPERASSKEQTDAIKRSIPPPLPRT
jgi:hypothetical protein